MKLKNIMETTASNYEYNRVRKLYLIKFANKDAKEWLGWDKGMAKPNCSCSTCKRLRSFSFSTSFKINRNDKNWKCYRKTQWK